MKFFVVSRGPRGPEGQIYHDEPPKMYGSEEKGRRLHTGSAIISGPVQLPPSLEGASIGDLMAAWKAHRQSGARIVVKVKAK